MSDDADEEAFEVRYRERHQRMLTQPPGCLAPFAVKRVPASELPGVRFDGHGEPHQSIFRVRCACGGETFGVRGAHHARDYKGDPLNFFGDPLELICRSCGRTELLFDREQHGYNAEIDRAADLMARERRPEGVARAEYACPGCGDAAMGIWTRFEHHAETCEDSFAEGLSAGREQDFFTWFTLVGRCGNCRRLQTVTEFECA